MSKPKFLSKNIVNGVKVTTYGQILDNTSDLCGRKLLDSSKSFQISHITASRHLKYNGKLLYYVTNSSTVIRFIGLKSGYDDKNCVECSFEIRPKQTVILSVPASTFTLVTAKQIIFRYIVLHNSVDAIMYLKIVFLTQSWEGGVELKCKRNGLYTIQTKELINYYNSTPADITVGMYTIKPATHLTIKIDDIKARTVGNDIIDTCYDDLPLAIQQQYVPIVSDKVHLATFYPSEHMRWRKSEPFEDTLTYESLGKNGIIYFKNQTGNIQSYDIHILDNLMPHLINGKITGVFKNKIITLKGTRRRICVIQELLHAGADFTVCDSDSD